MTSQTPCLTGLDLRLGLGLNRKTQQVRFLKKMIKKLLAQQKRITHLEIVFENPEYITRTFLKPLSFIRTLKYLKLKARCCHESAMEALNTHLKTSFRRKHWPMLRNHVLDLSINPHFEDEMQLNDDLFAFSQQLYKLAEVTPSSPPTQIYLTFRFNQTPNSDTLVSLAQAIQKLPFLVRVEATGNLPGDFSVVLNSLRSCKYLNEMFLFFSRSQSSPVLQNLPQSLVNIKALRSLTLWVDILQDSLPVKNIMKQFQYLKQLTNLSLYFWRGSYLDDQALNIFSQSLTQLNGLESLSIGLSVTEYPVFPASPKITGVGISRVFKAIGGLTSLQKLCIDLNGVKDQVSNRTFGELCFSLRQCKDLDCLKICIASNKLDDRGLNQLKRVLPMLKGLEYLSLEIMKCQWFESKTLAGLVQGLRGVKGLSHLDLRLQCLEIGEDFRKEMMRVLERVKSLGMVSLWIFRSMLNREVEDEMEDAVIGLQGKIQIDIQYF